MSVALSIYQILEPYLSTFFSKTTFKQLTKYFVTGLIGFFFSSEISKYFLELAGYFASYGIGYFAVGTIEFVIRKYWVFNKK